MKTRAVDDGATGDQGAHFRKCDFQVHTPRDPNWQGDKPTSDADRHAFAQAFVAACREKGLGGVAITDHHDFAMLPFIRAAAEAEVDQEGRQYPPHVRLAVFPGLELTLGVPCQALLILDSDFPDERLPDVLTALNIEPSDPSLPSALQPKVLGHLDSISKVHDALDLKPWMRGRYILLPNVTDGGHKTLIRKAFAPKYLDMPCVGGYLDGTVDEKVGKGNRNIFDGKADDWGPRRLALFQTSDSRSGDFSRLGEPSSWVKWARPTAEALRQACLAQESRISQTPPSLPGMAISRLVVANSKFLGPIDIALNPQFNALIGGRGTGKSTILDYIRWALCDQSPSKSAEVRDEAKETLQAELVQQTLAPYGVAVDIHFVLNDIRHVVRRHASTGDVELKIGDGTFAPSSPKEIRGLLPIHAYSQKQLSTVAVRTSELTKFVTSPIRRQLGEFDEQLDDLDGRIRETYASVLRARSLDRAIRQAKVRGTSLREQAENLRGSLGGLSEADQAVLASRQEYDGAKDAVSAWSDSLSEVDGAAESLVATVARLESALPEVPGGQDDFERLQHDAGKSVADATQTLRASLEVALAAFRTTVDSHSKPAIAVVQTMIEEFDKQYSAVKKRSTAHADKLKELADIEEQHATLLSTVKTQAAERLALADPEGDLERLRKEQSKVSDRRSSAIERECVKLSELSDDLISASLDRTRGLGSVRSILAGSLTGSGIRSKKFDGLFEELDKEEKARDTWTTVLDELERLADLEADVEGLTTEKYPTLGRLGFTGKDLDRIANSLTSEGWLSLAVARIPDEPRFRYRIGDGEYIDFAVASAGQQATALMRILLSQGGPPLLVDQPEDDLDSQIVQTIVEDIWKAKFRRQIIFASHNANLVVNGDADLVIGCDNRVTGDQSGGRIAVEGAIDIDEVRSTITTVMEGGEKAFRLRKEKYGF